MAQDLSVPKSNVALGYSQLSLALVKLINQATELHNMYFAEGFNSGGANPIVQGDLTSPNGALTPQILSNVDAILVTLTSTFNVTQMNQLRQALSGPII